MDVNALGWALAVVSSRAFSVRGEGQPSAMLPLVDMGNHSFEPNIEVLPIKDKQGAMALVTKRKASGCCGQST